MPCVPRKNSPRQPAPEAEIDLHGLAPEAALRSLARGLHAARLRRMRQVLVITGRGWGNAEQKPILRLKVEAFLRGADGARLGVSGLAVETHGGALRVTLRSDGDSRPRGVDDGDFEGDGEE